MTEGKSEKWQRLDFRWRSLGYSNKLFLPQETYNTPKDKEDTYGHPYSIIPGKNYYTSDNSNNTYEYTILQEIPP
jgi:hypothetical protein